MSETKYLKCACASCGGHIEFPADAIGSTVPCPHCGWQTELTIETPPVIAARPSRSLKWVIAGGVILVVGLIAVVGALVVASHLIKKKREARVESRTTPNVIATNRAPPNSARVTSPKLLNDFSFSAVTIDKAANSSLTYAMGSLKNETDKQRFGVTVELDLLDANGKKLGSTKDYAAVIEPRAEWKFHELLVQKNVASARVADIKEQQ